MEEHDLSETNLTNKSPYSRSRAAISGESTSGSVEARAEFQNWLAKELERLEADFSDYVTTKSLMKDIVADSRSR